MQHILDIPLDISNQHIIQYLKDNPQVKDLNMRDRINLEEALIKSLTNSKLTVSCYFDTDGTVTIEPLLFDKKAIVFDKNLLLKNNCIDTDE